LSSIVPLPRSVQLSQRKTLKQLDPTSSQLKSQPFN
jgi:hypothetical protein